MGRQRTGWVRFHEGAWRIGFTLRSGKQFERQVPPPQDGLPVDEAYAVRVKKQLLQEYARGTWDPETEQDRGALPGEDPTVLDYLRGWVKRQRYESAPEDVERVERYVAPAPFGRMKVREVKPRHAAAYVEWLKARPSERGGTLAPRSVRNIYDVVRRGHDAAVFDELLPANPFAAVKGRLPTVADKDPTAREGWYFDATEIAAMISDARVPRDRRTVYALLFLTGARFGEMAALRWRDYDTTRTPLARITITRAIKSVSGTEGGTKTGARKLVPVHAVLRGVLDAWREEGWATHQGRAPLADDLMFPNQNGASRDVNRGNRDFKRDLAKLGLRERHQYCTRHAFITLAQDDGGDPSVLKWITHAPPRSAFDGYTREQWDRLCREVAKLRVSVLAANDTTAPETAASPTNTQCAVEEVRTQPRDAEQTPPQPSAEIPWRIPWRLTVRLRKVLSLQRVNESGREDLNLRLPGPEPGALPGCATPRMGERCVVEPLSAVKHFSRNSQTA
jgi:integrase